MSESEIILKVENVSKQYRLGTVGTRTLSGDVHRWWTTKILGKEDPFLKVGTVNDRTSKEKTDFVWALRDINFEVKRGEVLGIIGKNGAGKSTLLKLLSRITAPTTGSIKSNGRMASLLEVGTGFHPELTGRENIYLNGAILGMTKKEINSKFDEIVDFSGCSLYIDTPVKRYSSGMTVRLGFAVAAFLDPEILVVDEVLAVGDAEFQKKAIGKMKDVSNLEGRTVLFVSHNMDAVEQLCNSVIIMDKGKIKDQRDSLTVKESIDMYLNPINEKRESGFLKYNDIENPNETTIEEVYLKNSYLVWDFYDEIEFLIKINFRRTVTLSVELINNFGTRILYKENKVSKSGIYSFKIKPMMIMAGSYGIRAFLSIPNVETIQVTDFIRFNVKSLPPEFLIYSNLDKNNYPFGYFYLSENINIEQ